MSCIYGIKDTITDTIVYVGQTTSFSSRKSAYTVPNPAKKHNIISYMRSFSDWETRFSIYIIRRCGVGSLTEFENYYIRTLNPTHNRVRPKQIPHRASAHELQKLDASNLLHRS